MSGRPARLAVSVGKVDITPPAGTLLAGYGVDSPRVATAAHRPLWARCTVLWDDGRPHVVLTADVLGFGRASNTAVRRRVAALGVAGPDFVLAATHTHNGPVLTDPIDPHTLYGTGEEHLPGIRDRTDRLVTDLAGLVAATLAGPRTGCTLDHRVTSAGFAVNREGLAHAERDVPVLVARSPAGAPLAVLFGYGCHPVAAGIRTAFDPDYPGTAVSWIEDRTGCFAQFLLGPAGDQDPTGERGWSNSDALGQELGRAVVTSTGVPGRAVTGPIRTGYRDVALDLELTDPAAARASYASRTADPAQPGYLRRHAAAMVEQLDRCSFATAVPLPVQVWRFPALRVVFSGGELVSGYGVHLRSRYGADRTWVVGYANECPAYLPTDELLHTNPGIHYACGWSPDHPDVAGGAMAVYGWMGRFRGRPPGATGPGVEQTVLGAITSMLAE